MPLYIVLEFSGTDDVDKWWRGLLNKQLSAKEPFGRPSVLVFSDFPSGNFVESKPRACRYVSKIKLMTRDMLRGLRLLGESKTDRQWVHHDLKPMNMVYNEEQGPLF